MELLKGGNLTSDEMAELLEMGASKEFVLLANYPSENRNSVHENARTALEHGRTSFGHFGTSMWESDLYSAMKRADGTNTELLREVFGLAYINAQSKHEHGREGYKVKDGRVVYK